MSLFLINTDFEKHCGKCRLINEGGKFTIKPLPEIAQYAPINGIILQDLDGDKIVDMLLAGNFFGLKPEVGRWDASYGVFLKGKGNLVLYPMPKQVLP